MGSEVGGDGEVAVEGGRPQLILQPGQVGRLPTDQGQHLLSQRVSPFGQSPLVCAAHTTPSAQNLFAAGARIALDSVRDLQ